MRLIGQDEKTKFSILKKLSAAQKDMPKINKSDWNPFTKSNYASLTTVYNVVKPVLDNHNLALIQDFGEITGNTISVKTIIYDENAILEFNPIVLPVDKGTAQRAGASVTYARRYSLVTNLSLDADEDDDGNLSSGKTKQKENYGNKRNYNQRANNYGQAQTRRQQPAQRSTAKKTVNQHAKLEEIQKRAVAKIGQDAYSRILVNAMQVYKTGDPTKLNEQQLTNFNQYLVGSIKGELSK